MNAENFGRRLLGEVETVTMDEILPELIQLSETDPEYETGISALDSLLRPVLERHGMRPREAHPSSKTRKRRLGSVIELTSATLGAGKTHLLYWLVSQAVFPSVNSKPGVKGANSAVVVLDTDNRFEIERFASVLRNCINSALKSSMTFNSSGNSEADGVRTENNAGNMAAQGTLPRSAFHEDHVEELLDSSLRHIHVFRPQSLQALVATLENLECYLTDLSSHFSRDRQISTVVLDSASTFYWQHRSDEAARQINKIEGARTAQAVAESPLYTRLLRSLQAFQDKFDSHVIFTSQSSWQSNNSPAVIGRPGLRPLLPISWADYPTVQLLLRRVPVAKFTLGMGAREAWVDRDMRRDAVKQGRFTASIVDSSGAERKAFDFKVGSTGVHIEGGGQPPGVPGQQ